MEYLHEGLITAVKRTDTPSHHSVSGYGSKLPTQYMVQIEGGRWHRVYVIQYSNAGSAYILLNGKRLFIQYETTLEVMADEYEKTQGAA